MGGAKPRQRRQRLSRHRFFGLLESRHLEGDGPQALGGVVDPHRERGEHGRDLVLQRAVPHRHGPGAAGPYRHRHQGAHDPIDRFAPGAEQLAKAVGDRRQDDVVEGATQSLADPLDVVHGGRRPRVAAVRAERAVEAGDRSGPDQARPSTTAPGRPPRPGTGRSAAPACSPARPGAVRRGCGPGRWRRRGQGRHRSARGGAPSRRRPGATAGAWCP